MGITNDICSICLEDIDKYHIKELSCGHKIHYKCFLNISIRKNFWTSNIEGLPDSFFFF